MRNVVIVIILSISFIIGASILAKDRYKIIMNDGQSAGLITIKCDTVTGRTWRLALPENNFLPAVAGSGSENSAAVLSFQESVTGS